MGLLPLYGGRHVIPGRCYLAELLIVVSSSFMEKAAILSLFAKPESENASPKISLKTSKGKTQVLPD